MRLHRKTAPAAAAETEDRLATARPFAHDDETRPSGEDRNADHSLLTSFSEPVPMPDWLHRHRRKKG